MGDEKLVGCVDEVFDEEGGRAYGPRPEVNGRRLAPVCFDDSCQVSIRRPLIRLLAGW
jgi:hypothetical protein